MRKAFWCLMIMAVAGYVFGGLGLAFGADLPVKAPRDVPVIGYNPFWIGIGAGVGMSKTENELTFGGVSTGTIKGFPTGALVGPSFGYTASAGSLLYGFAVNGYYDFSRGCVTDIPNMLPCVAGRKNGFLVEEALEIGMSLSGQNSLLPSPLPAPPNIPVSIWSAITAKARVGVAERVIDLCVFNVTGIDPVTGPFGTNQCGSKFIAAPLAGLMLEVQATQNSTLGAKWDHIFWGGKNNQAAFDFVPTSAVPIFSNVVAARDEDIFTIEWRYHLAPGGFLGF